MNDQVLGALLVLVDRGDDAADHLFFEAQRRVGIVASHLIAQPAGQPLVEPPRDLREVQLRRLLRNVQNLLTQEVAVEKQDQQDLGGLERHQVDVLHTRLRSLWCAGHCGVLGHRGGGHGDALDQALHVRRGDAQLVGDVGGDLLRHSLQVHEKVDEIAVAGVGRDAPRRRVGLRKVTGLGQLGQLAADSGRGEVHEVAALQRL